MESVSQYWSEDSRADLVIEDVSKDSTDVTIGMRETDEDVSYYVYFDQENIVAPDGSATGGKLILKVADLDNIQEDSGSVENAVTDFPYDILYFTFNDIEFSIDIDYTDVTDHTELAAAINAAFAEATIVESGETMDVTPFVEANVATDFTAIHPETGTSYDIPSIEISKLDDNVVGDFAQDASHWDASGSIPGDSAYYSRVEDEASSVINALTMTNVILDRVGKDCDGGELVIGSESVDACAGIQQFNIDVDRDSYLSLLASTNDTLEVVNVENISTNNTDGDGDLTIASLSNVRVFDAAGGSSNSSAMTGDVNLTATLDGSIVGKYLDLQDDATSAAADNSEETFYDVNDTEFSYDFGSGNDTLDLTMASDTNAQQDGTSEREDFVMHIDGNGGNDTITTNIDEDALTNWLANHKENANLSIDGGTGNDTITTEGAGDWTITAGTGNDTVYSDNTGAKAEWAVNANLEGAVLRVDDEVTHTVVVDGADDNDETVTVTYDANGSAAGGSATVAAIAITDPTNIIATAGEIVAALNLDAGFAAVATATDNLDGTYTIVYDQADNGDNDVATSAAYDGGSTLTGGDITEGAETDGVLGVAGAVDTADLDSAGVGATAILYGAELTVTYSGALGVNTEAAAANNEGFESTVTIGVNDYVGNQANVNQAIKDAINNDDVLNKLLVVNDGPANSLVITALVDGVHASTDIEITVAAATLADLSASEQTALQDAYEQLQGDSTATLTQVILDGYATTAQTAATPEIDSVSVGAAAANEGSDNTTNLGAGDDVLVLSTDADSAETIAFSGSDIGNNTIVNFSLADDILDFTSYFTDVEDIPGSGSENSETVIPSNAVLDNAANIDLTSHEVTIVNDFAQTSATVDTWAAMTAADVDAALTDEDGDNSDDYANLANNTTAADGQLDGTTQTSILMIENDLNDGEYKVFEVTETIASDAHEVTLLGTIDFGDTIDATIVVA
jgi:hypothetical protein